MTERTSRAPTGPESNKTPPIFGRTVGTGGHVDHGKTALVKCLTGIDADRLQEEKRRHISIDLGYASLLLDDGSRVGILDVPGHERFVRHMVAGATSIDVALLVVAADDSVMPQTREHLDIFRLLKTPTGLVAISKTDLADSECIEFVHSDIRELVAGTFLEQAPVVEVSCVTGEGIATLRARIAERITSLDHRDASGIFRMPIQRVFTLPGAGTIVTGIPASGRVGVEDRVEVVPGGGQSRIRRIEVHGASGPHASAGHCAALNLPDIDHTAVRRGYVAATPGYLETVADFQAHVTLLDHASAQIDDRKRVHIHAGTFESTGEVMLLGRRSLKRGETGLVHVRLASPAVVAARDRFLIRGGGVLRTIGGGVVIRTAPKPPRFHPTTVDRLQVELQAQGDPASRAAHRVRMAGREPVAVRELARGLLMHEHEALALATRVAVTHGLTVVGGARTPVSLTSRDNITSAEQSIVTALASFHRSQPYQRGMTRALLRKGVPWHEDIVAAALENLVARADCEVENGIIRLAGFEVRLPEKLRRTARRVERIYLQDGCLTQRLEFATKRIGGLPDEIEMAFRFLVGMGVLVVIGDGLPMHRENLEAAKRTVVNALRERERMQTCSFRDLLGSNRRCTVALLEHCDRIGLTSYDGQDRRLKQQR